MLPVRETVIYARKSSESEDRQVLSIQSQVEELRRIAEQRGLRIDRVLEEAKSAKAPGRPVFNALIADVQAGRVGRIVCWKADRLARNVMDAAAVIYALDQGNLDELVTANGTTFTSRPEDKLMLNLDFGLSAKFIDDLRANVHRGMKKKVEMGWFPGNAPIGYLNDLRSRTIVPDPDRFDAVRRLWMLAASGVPLNELARRASEDWGLRTPVRGRLGGGPIMASLLYKLFSNRFYTGVFTMRGVTYHGNHAPMVTVAEFEAVQEILRRPSKARRQKHLFAFAGTIRCGECGSLVIGTSHTKKSGLRFDYYRCRKAQRCSQRHVRTEELEAQVIEALAQHEVSDELLSVARSHLDHMRAELAAAEAQSEARRLSEIERLEQQRHQLTQMRMREQIDDVEYDRERSRLVLETQQLRSASRPTDGVATPRGVELAVEPFSLMNAAVSRFRAGSEFDKRCFLLALCSNPLLRDGKLLITAKKPMSLLAEKHRFPSWQALVEAVRTSVASEEGERIAAFRSEPSRMSLRRESSVASLST